MQFSLLATIALAVWLVSTPEVNADPAQTELCLRLAGSPEDGELNTPGVAFGDIIPEQAVPACQAATTSQASGNDARILFTYGRALTAANRYEDARIWYEKAAALDFALALNNLGVFHLQGIGGVKKNADVAIEYFTKAGNLGLPRGYYSAAEAFRAKGDFQGAAGQYRAAADSGMIEAMRRAAQIYQGSFLDTVTDYKISAHYWSMLAETGDIDALFQLAELIADGFVQPENLESTEVLYSRASAAGHSMAALRYAKILEAKIPEGGRAEDALTEAYHAYDLLLKEPKSSEYSWPMNQQTAGALISNIVKANDIPPRSQREYEEITRDFAPSEMVTYTVTITCGESDDVPFKVYVWDWTRDYSPVQLQAEWVETARGCEFPEDSRKAFESLFKTAKDGNESFVTVTRYALQNVGRKPQRDERDTQTLRREPDQIRVVQITDSSTIFEPMEMELVFTCSGSRFPTRFLAWPGQPVVAKSSHTQHVELTKETIVEAMISILIDGTPCNIRENIDTLGWPEIWDMEDAFEKVPDFAAAMGIAENSAKIEELESPIMPLFFDTCISNSDIIRAQNLGIYNGLVESRDAWKRLIAFHDQKSLQVHPYLVTRYQKMIESASIALAKCTLTSPDKTTASHISGLTVEVSAYAALTAGLNKLVSFSKSDPQPLKSGDWDVRDYGWAFAATTIATPQDHRLAPADELPDIRFSVVCMLVPDYEDYRTQWIFMMDNVARSGRAVINFASDGQALLWDLRRDVFPGELKGEMAVAETLLDIHMADVIQRLRSESSATLHGARASGFKQLNDYTLSLSGSDAALGSIERDCQQRAKSLAQ